MPRRRLLDATGWPTPRRQAQPTALPQTSMIHSRVASTLLEYLAKPAQEWPSPNRVEDPGCCQPGNPRWMEALGSSPLSGLGPSCPTLSHVALDAAWHCPKQIAMQSGWLIPQSKKPEPPECPNPWRQSGERGGATKADHESKKGDPGIGGKEHAAQHKAFRGSERRACSTPMAGCRGKAPSSQAWYSSVSF